MRPGSKQSYDEYMAELRITLGWRSMADSRERLFPPSEITKYDLSTWAMRVFGTTPSLTRIQ